MRNRSSYYFVNNVSLSIPIAVEGQFSLLIYSGWWPLIKTLLQNTYQMNKRDHVSEHEDKNDSNPHDKRFIF